MSSQKPQVVRPPKQFDLAKFETMVEPFSVRVDKIKGTTKYEIPLPLQDGGGAAGTGWTKEQVRDIQTWLVNEWSGGGHYNIAVTDASMPPQLMEWTTYYPVHEFPEKVPPTLQAAFMPNVPQTTTPQAKPTMAQFPGSGSSLPSAALYPQVPMAQMPAPQPSPYYGQPPVPYGYATPIMQASQPNTSASNETAMLREALARAREEAQQRDFERRLAEMKAESDRRFVELQQSMQAMVGQMTAAMKEQHKPIDANAVAQAETIRRLEERLAQQAAEAERARRESELRDEIRRTQEATAKLVEESNRRFEAFMQTNANKGPDAQVMMFQQMFSAQMETMKELARNSQVQLDRVQNHIMRPQDILAIAKESQSSSDHVANNLARQYESMFNLQRALVEQAAQLNQGGGGNEVIGLIRDAGGQLAEMARKYTGDKSKETVAQVNAQAEIARAQAEVQKAQLDSVARMAAVEAAMKHGQPAQMPNGAYAAPAGPQQAAVAAPGVNPARPWQGSKPAGNGLNGTPTNGTAAPNNVVPIMTGDTQIRRTKGRTDAEWFGVMTGHVQQLRDEVAKFIKALEESPPRKDGAAPDETAFAIQQAATEVMRRQIPIPAMIELLMQGMVPDFLDILLPDAPQAYRDDVVKLLMQPDDEDEDEGDDDEEEDQPQAS